MLEDSGGPRLFVIASHFADAGAPVFDQAGLVGMLVFDDKSRGKTGTIVDTTSLAQLVHDRSRQGEFQSDPDVRSNPFAGLLLTPSNNLGMGFELGWVYGPAALTGRLLSFHDGIDLDEGSAVERSELMGSLSLEAQLRVSPWWVLYAGGGVAMVGRRLNPIPLMGMREPVRKERYTGALLTLGTVSGVLEGELGYVTADGGRVVGALGFTWGR